jgi:hypothetical protein
VPGVDPWLDRDQLVLPRHGLRVGLHDPEVRDDGGEVGAHHGREVAVEIVRRHVDLVRVGHRRDLHRLSDPVPGDVDDRDVHRVPLEERAVFPAPEQALP